MTANGMTVRSVDVQRIVIATLSAKLRALGVTTLTGADFSFVVSTVSVTRAASLFSGITLVQRVDSADLVAFQTAIAAVYQTSTEGMGNMFSVILILMIGCFSYNLHILSRDANKYIQVFHIINIFY